MRTLTETLHHINEALATLRRYRPCWSKGYTMAPCLTEEELLAFEQRHHCTLPAEYREFLRIVGEVGPGPDLGLFSPRQHFAGSGFEECWEENVDLSVPFPHTEAWTEGPDPECDIDYNYLGDSHVCGSLPISDRGCGLRSRIVITGPLAGEIWHDDRGDGGGLCPSLTPDGSRWNFLPWYLDWLEPELEKFGRPGARAQSRTRSWRE